MAGKKREGSAYLMEGLSPLRPGLERKSGIGGSCNLTMIRLKIGCRSPVASIPKRVLDRSCTCTGDALDVVPLLLGYENKTGGHQLPPKGSPHPVTLRALRTENPLCC